jgi:sensor histidine kinase YesM
VTVGEEWEFVRRYLDIEALRFGPRLAVTVDLPTDSREAMVPSFSIQTLVENAVRHGVTPSAEPTTVSIGSVLSGDRLTITVADTGGGADLTAPLEVSGTGIRRLRERLAVLFGTTASLGLASQPGRGFVATLVVPQLADE